MLVTFACASSVYDDGNEQLTLKDSPSDLPLYTFDIAPIIYSMPITDVRQVSSGDKFELGRF